MKRLFEQIMKENFPKLAKQIDFQEVQEAQSIPKKLDARKHPPRHIIITLPKIKDKERIFFLKILFILFLDKQERRKRRRETSMCGCLSHAPYWGPGCNPGLCPDWESNW